VSSETDAGGDADRTADGGYVHAPEGSHSGAAHVSGGPDEPDADGFGTRGWALTAVLFTCVLVIPGVIYLYPYAAGAFGFTFFATYLALPLVPALLLGLVAVWSMTAATRDQ
jgi:hypothetical protein